MNKICHMTCDHGRYDTRVFQKECRSLAKNGYDVSLIVADGMGDETKDGVSIFDIGSNRGTRIERIRNYLRIKKMMLKKAIELDCSIYQFHDPELITIGRTLSKRGKKVIFDMHEDFPQYFAEKDYLPFSKTIAFFYEWFENKCVKDFAGVISTRQCINDRVEKINKNVQLVTNFPVLVEKYERNEPPCPTIVFAGAIDDGWRHKLIINALDKFDNIKYILAGNAKEAYLNELKQLPGWKKVEFLGKIPFEQVCDLYQNATMGVAIYYYCNNMGWKEGNLANNKMFEFMNFGLPYICTDYTLWKQIVEEEEKCGICVNPDDQEQLIRAIKYLIDNKNVRVKMGENGRKAVAEKYNWATQEKLLLDFYAKIATS